MKSTSGQIRQQTNDEDTNWPADLHVERALLGAIVESCGALLPIARLSGLRADDFALDSHRRIFKRMCHLQDSDRPVDLVSLIDELRRCNELDRIGGHAYVADLVAGVLIDWERIQYHASIIVRDSRLRQQVKLGDWLRSRAAQPDADPNAIARIVASTMENILKVRSQPGEG